MTDPHLCEYEAGPEALPCSRCGLDDAPVMTRGRTSLCAECCTGYVLSSLGCPQLERDDEVEEPARLRRAA